MNIFLDTNVVIDFIFERKEFFDSAKRILQQSIENHDSLFVSALTFVTTLYVSKHYQKSIQQTIQSLKGLAEFIHIVDLTSNNVIANLSEPWKDYEDSTQFYCAKSCRSDIIITRNPKDFELSTITVMTPDEFLHSNN